MYTHNIIYIIDAILFQAIIISSLFVKLAHFTAHLPVEKKTILPGLLILESFFLKFIFIWNNETETF